MDCHLLVFCDLECVDVDDGRDHELFAHRVVGNHIGDGGTTQRNFKRVLAEFVFMFL